MIFFKCFHEFATFYIFCCVTKEGKKREYLICNFFLSLNPLLLRSSFMLISIIFTFYEFFLTTSFYAVFFCSFCIDIKCFFYVLLFHNILSTQKKPKKHITIYIYIYYIRKNNEFISGRHLKKALPSLINH